MARIKFCFCSVNFVFNLTFRRPLYIFCSQIVAEYMNATFSLVNKIKMIGMPLYLVHR